MELEHFGLPQVQAGLNPDGSRITTLRRPQARGRESLQYPPLRKAHGVVVRDDDVIEYPDIDET